MLHRRAFTTLSVVMAFGLGCNSQAPVSPSNETPAFAPADGNGNKSVFTVDFTTNVTCPGSGVVLSRHNEGWFQVRTFSGTGNRNVELDVFHIVLTFTNAAGETYVFRDVGPDHYYLNKDGDLIIAITGRSTGSGVIGHVVINLDTGETLLVAGNEFGSARALACEALT